MTDSGLNKKYRILIVDDEPLNVECFFDLLSNEGYTIAVARDGKMCIELARQLIPSIIIIDWDLPEIDGIEAIKILKAEENTNQIPIIMATGKMLTSEHLKTALEAGAYDFLRKPLDAIEVIARVKSMLRLHDKHQQNIYLKQQLHEQQLIQLNEDLERNKKSLTSSTLRLLQLSEGYEKIIKQLETVEKLTNNEGRALLNTIIASFKSNVESSNWEEFEVVFEKVHLGFYEQLNKQYPNLTPNERRICAFLKLGMTTKKIASITCQSEDAVKKARFRLRKKLDISGNSNIVSYIQSI